MQQTVLKFSFTGSSMRYKKHDTMTLYPFASLFSLYGHTCILMVTLLWFYLALATNTDNIHTCTSPFNTESKACARKAFMELVGCWVSFPAVCSATSCSVAGVGNFSGIATSATTDSQLLIRFYRASSANRCHWPRDKLTSRVLPWTFERYLRTKGICESGT